MTEDAAEDRPRARMITLPREGPGAALESIKRFFFRVLSRTGVAVYSRVPIFGRLRASVVIIRNGDLILVIDRSDGRGLSFPGGLALPWEEAEQAMRREVFEETGLQIEKASVLFEYPSSADIPCLLTVFEGATTGEITASWEGLPRWLPWSEIRTSLLPSQKEIVDRLL
jgi:8-oxo-dGTP pyrophosphatase MutT (NUDIX family)